MLEFLKSFLALAPFIPHGHCYLWQLDLVGLHLISDALIALTSCSIPVILVYFVNKKFKIEERTTELKKTNEQLRNEIMERQRVEEEIRFLQTMTQAISESLYFHSAIEVVLHKVCEVMGWKFGEAWIPTPDGKTLECSSAWYGSNQNLEFRQSNEGLKFSPATGLPGRVWKSKYLESWIDDFSSLSDTVFLRTYLAIEADFKAGFGIPIISCCTEGENSQVLAVLVFFMSELRQEDKRRVKIVSTVANQLAPLLQGKQAKASLRASEERFRLRDGTFVNFKAAKDNNLLVPSREFLGKKVYEVLPQEVAAPIMDCVEPALQTDEIQIFEYQLAVNNQSRDGDARIVVSAKDEVMAIVRDITERKWAEEDIRNALKKQGELSELRSRFVTMTSHEFRTPLTTILSSAQLETYSNKMAEEKKLQHLYRIQTAVKHMTQMLNNVLLFGKADVGKLEFKPEPVDLVKFCRDLVEDLQISTGNSHTIAFCSKGQDTTAFIDEALLLCVLSNLLSNAIKYSLQNGTVYFDFICQQGEAIFHVQDRGIGIPLADQAQLFNSFHRAPSAPSLVQDWGQKVCGSTRW